MNIPKYKKIYDQIIKLILTNEWPVGSNMKSENELIKLFGVSRLTIRNVLNILENDHLKYPVYTSEYKKWHLVYKGNRDLFYFEPIKQSEFMRSAETDYKKPVLKLRRYISDQ